MSEYSWRDWAKDQAAAKAISDMGNTVSTVVAQRNQAWQKINELEQESDDLIKHAKKWVNHAKNLEKRIEQLQETVADTRTELQETEERLATKSADYRSLEKKNNEITKQNADKSETIKELQRLLAVHSTYLNKISFQKKVNVFIASNAEDTKRVLEELKKPPFRRRGASRRRDTRSVTPF